MKRRQPEGSRISSNTDGSLDEVVATGRIHLEQMSDIYWWMRIYLPDGRSIDVNFWTPRTKIRVHWSLDGGDDHRWAEAGEFGSGIVPPPAQKIEL